MLKKFTHILLLIVILAGFFALNPATSALAAGLCYVNDNAGGSNNGTSWANDYTSLQSAIADSCTEIWVAAGTYKPHASDRTVSFNLESGTAIYGGFAGTETLRSERDFITNVTILSGDLNGDDNGNIIYTEPTRSENSYHVVEAFGTLATAILDGFTVTSGNASEPLNFDFYGGGINLINGASPTLNNLIISNNSAQSAGGLYKGNGGTPALTNITFIGNHATGNGGGMYSFNHSPVLTNITFNSNSTGGSGGGLVTDGGTPSLTNIIFINNIAQSGGGMYLTANSSPTLTNVAFITNSASAGSGGGISSGNSNASLTNVTFSGNSATSFGGGIYNLTGNHSLTNVTFSDNSATTGGGIYNANSSTPTLKNVIIANSTGGDCVNSSSSLNAPSSNNLIESTGSNACGLTDGVDGNIIGFDPDLGTLTGSPAYLPLNVGSPAINTGTNTGCPSTDQRGVTRPQGDNCDIGAYEYQDLIDPLVVSITRAGTSPTSAATVDFTVTFSEAVQNVDINDFILTKSSGISGESIFSVSGSGASYTVTTNTGTGSGTLRLDIPVSATIQDLSNNVVDGLPFTSGESYTKVVSATFKSNAANDGWILESSETSNTGGTLNSAQTTFTLGDDAADKQYRAILHFDTSALPDTAVVTNMTLKIKQQGSVTGTSPFSFASLYVDMRNPAFGGSALELTDFNFAAKKVKPAVFNPTPVSGWFSARFNTGGKLYVNRTGVSQLRLYFSVDDNNNNIADFIRFFSGNAAAGDRPKLLINYYVP